MAWREGQSCFLVADAQEAKGDGHERLIATVTGWARRRAFATDDRRTVLLRNLHPPGPLHPGRVTPHKRIARAPVASDAPSAVSSVVVIALMRRPSLVSALAKTILALSQMTDAVMEGERRGGHAPASCPCRLLGLSFSSHAQAHVFLRRPRSRQNRAKA
jgi:hypothetical protein